MKMRNGILSLMEMVGIIRWLAEGLHEWIGGRWQGLDMGLWNQDQKSGHLHVV
jgi:hypothetical protein